MKTQVWCALIVALLAAICVQATVSSPSSYDESAILSEVYNTPLSSSEQGLMDLSDLSAESLSLLEQDAHDDELPDAAALLQIEQHKKGETGKAKATAQNKATAKTSTKKNKSTAKAQSKQSKSKSKSFSSKSKKSSKSSKGKKSKKDKKGKGKKKADLDAWPQKRYGAVKKGVDLWSLQQERSVYQAPLGVVIGNIPASVELVIEEYKYKEDKKKGEKALYGWGYITGNGAATFGGWAGENACGWFPLQRTKSSLKQEGSFTRSIVNHPKKCGASKKAPLKPEQLFKRGTYASNGAVAKAVTTKVCAAFRNYDPKSQLANEAAPSLPAGAFSGKGAIGTVPAGIAQSKKVDSFGVKYVTKDGKYAAVRYPSLDPQHPGYNTFFVDCSCLQFDEKAVATVNKFSLIEMEADMETEDEMDMEMEDEDEMNVEDEDEMEDEDDMDAEDEDEFDAEDDSEDESDADDEAEDEFDAESESESESEPASFPSALMELSSETASPRPAPVAASRHRGTRGNYPGWTSMIEMAAREEPAAAAEADAAAPAADSAPATQPAPAESTSAVAETSSFGGVTKHISSGPNVHNIRLNENHAAARIQSSNTGISKIHVHVYGDQHVEENKVSKLKAMVTRLAATQAESYDKINALMKKMKRCAGKTNPKECVATMTEKIKDWKAEYAAKAQGDAQRL